MANTAKRIGDFVMVNRGEHYEPAVAIVVSTGNENEEWEDRTLGLAFLPPAQWVPPGDGIGQWSDTGNGAQPLMATEESTDYTTWTNDQLKTELRRREIVVPAGGTKADFVRLLEQDDELT
jgi:hypothetical protein